MRRSKPWITELWLIGSVLLCGGLFFHIFHWGLIFVVATLSVYCAWHLWQLRRLIRWLTGGNRAMPDHVPGLWHEVFLLLYYQRRQQRKAKRRMLTIFEEFRDSTNALDEAAVALGSYNEILWCNRAAERLLGLRAQRDIGQRIANLLRHPRFVEFVGSGEPDQTLEIPSPVSSQIMLSFELTPYRKVQRLLMVRDVTRLHKLEQVRQDFVANVSHELRTPITVLSGYLETLSEAGPEKLGRYTRPVQQMQTQAARMAAIVDDLLYLSRLDNERYRLSFERVATPDLVRQLADEAKVLSGSNQHDIQVQTETGLCLMASLKDVQSAFSNLISNAVRYTPAKGKITIRWFRNPSSEAVFSVTDTGPGIEAMHLPRLTERFYRVDPGRSRDAGGTGLGLAIVKHIIERHGARLDIQSEVGKGSCFQCIFPAASCIQVQNN